MTTLAITGIGGFIGLRMAERALALGWQVQGLDHSLIAAERAHALGIQVTVGDINDEATLKAAFAGADMVFHTAAIVEEDGPREAYERVNVEGTRTVCRIAQAQGVQKLLHLSSVMVYGFDYPADVTEDGPLNGQGNIYNETKLTSEQVAVSSIMSMSTIYSMALSSPLTRPRAVPSIHSVMGLLLPAMTSLPTMRKWRAKSVCQPCLLGR